MQTKEKVKEKVDWVKLVKKAFGIKKLKEINKLSCKHKIQIGSQDGKVICHECGKNLEGKEIRRPKLNISYNKQNDNN